MLAPPNWIVPPPPPPPPVSLATAPPSGVDQEMNAAFPNALNWHTRSVQPPGIVSAALTPKLGRVGLLAASRQAAFAEKTATTASRAARESVMAVSRVSGDRRASPG